MAFEFPGVLSLYKPYLGWSEHGDSHSCAAGPWEGLSETLSDFRGLCGWQVLAIEFLVAKCNHKDNDTVDCPSDGSQAGICSRA